MKHWAVLLTATLLAACATTPAPPSPDRLFSHVNLTLGNKQQRFGASLYEADLLTIDFLPPAEVRGLRTRVIDEKAIVAMYMNNRAVESMALGRLDDAYWWVRAAIGEDPRSQSAYNTLGAIYQRHGDLTQAASVLTYALEREPKNTRAMSNLVTVLTGLGRVAEATELARKLERLDPDPPFSFFDRGLAAMQKGDYRAAKEMFTREVRRAPYYHEFHFWLAAACVGLGEFQQAREEMTIALEMSTKRSDRDLYAAKLDRITSHWGQ